MPALYIVATPIGNLEDISLRAIRILGKVKLIAAEDTRTTRHLLETYNIKTPLTSYHEYNKRTKLKSLIERLQEEDVALVSEAGMPGISDTGYELITEAINNNIKVVAIPGASAIITALVMSGLPVDQFIYLGFLPRRKGERISLLESVMNEQRTMVLFESPHRLIKSLKNLCDILGDRKLAVCREMTKLYEEVFRGTITEAIEHFIKPRGEFTLVIEGCKKGTIEAGLDLTIEMRRLKQKGFTAKDTISKIWEKTGASKKKLYRLWLEMNKGD